MKKVILLFLFISTTTITHSQNKAQKVFEKHIKVIEDLFAGKEIDKLDESVTFLQDITGIKSEISPGFVITFAPTEQNLKDWKEWYAKNKKQLSWNKKNKEIRVKLKK